KIYTYGSDKPTGFWFPHEHLGLLSREACNDLYNRCQVGICLSASNPSRVPFEMMASGLPVVDLHRSNNLYDIADGTALLAEAEPYAVAEAAIALLDDQERSDAMSRAGRSFTASRSESSERQQFAGAVERILAGQIPRDLQIQQAYRHPPVR